MKTSFVIVGDDCGNSTPTVDRQQPDRLHFGEGTIDLGFYIGVLATEYRLLEDNRQDTSDTVEELYYALGAFNRLDHYAESSWDIYRNTGDVVGCPGFPTLPPPDDLNGFFIRRDGAVNAGDVPAFVAQLNSGLPFYADFPVVHVPPLDRPTEVSQDQVYSLLVGFALVAKLVDSNVTYLGLNLVEETKDIVTRMVEWIKQHDWTIINPVRGTCVWGINEDCWDGTVTNPLKCCETGGALTQLLSYGLAEAANKIVGPSGPGFHDSFSLSTGAISWAVLNALPTVMHDPDFFMELGAIGDSVHPLIIAGLALDTGYEDLPLVQSVLHNRSSVIPRKIIECLLDSAPCRGPFGRRPNGKVGTYEWSRPNRFKGATARGTPSAYTRDSEYNAVDYMFLHNLYYLVYADELPPYRRIQANPADPDCDFCDPADDVESVNCTCVLAIETEVTCKTFCRTTKRKCKKECRTVKKACKNTCKGCKATCKNGTFFCTPTPPNQHPDFSSCAGLSGSALKKCCRQRKRDCKGNCRQTSRVCKTVCTEAYETCKEICRTGSTPERLNYCRKIAAPP